MATAVDPWGDEDTQPVAAVATVEKAKEDKSAPVADEIVYACPHCGENLRPHYDAVGSLHCDNKECVGCCFLPPDETSDGKVRGKFEARPCPMAAKVSGF